MRANAVTNPGPLSAAFSAAAIAPAATTAAALDFESLERGSARSAALSARRVTTGATATASFAAFPAVSTMVEDVLAAVDTARGRYRTPAMTTSMMSDAVATRSQRMPKGIWEICQNASDDAGSVLFSRS